MIAGIRLFNARSVRWLDVGVVVWIVVWAALGVPLTTPVPELKLSPVGTAGAMPYVTVPTKLLLDVSAAVGVMAVPAVAVMVWLEGVSAGSAGVADALAPAPVPAAFVAFTSNV